MREALTALLVKSANDAALTLASYVAGDEKKFTVLMNRRARELGTHAHALPNSRGTPEPGHYSSARDLATLGRFAMRDATFRELVRTKSAVIHYPPDAAVPVENHNRLLDYPWGDGIKTGATAASGKVLVGSGKPGPVALIVVTMHEPTRDQEVKDAVALFEWGTAEYLRRSAASAHPRRPPRPDGAAGRRLRGRSAPASRSAERTGTSSTRAMLTLASTRQRVVHGRRVLGRDRAEPQRSRRTSDIATGSLRSAGVTPSLSAT